jgi:hypothetical protein
LWLVAVVCFGPLIAVWLLGVIMLPFWAAMMVFQVTQPERFALDASGSLWDFVWPIALVIFGFIGLVGLARVLTLSHRERPKSHRVVTLGIVAAGLVPLLVFDTYLVGRLVADFSEGIPLAALAIYLVLPFSGAAWLLLKSWPFLIAGSRRDRG